jgi:hypothetical protein
MLRNCGKEGGMLLGNQEEAFRAYYASMTDADLLDCQKQEFIYPDRTNAHG